MCWASILLDVSLLFPSNSSSIPELSERNSLSLSKESSFLSDPRSDRWISFSLFSCYTCYLICFKNAKFWLILSTNLSFLFFSVLIPSGDNTAFEFVFGFVVLKILVFLKVSGGVLPISSSSIEGGSLSSASEDSWNY